MRKELSENKKKESNVVRVNANVKRIQKRIGACVRVSEENFITVFI